MSKRYISDTEIAKHCKIFADKICEIGVSSLSSRELQNRTVELIINIRSNLDLNSNFQLSKDLLIPESKLNKILYEIDLRNQNDSFEILENAIRAFEINAKGIIIDIQSEYARNMLKDELRKLKHFSDSSFNKDLVKLSYEAFIAVVNKFAPNSEKKREFKLIAQKFKSTQKTNEFKGAIKDFVCKIPFGGLVVDGIKILSSATECVDNYIERTQLENE